MENQNKRATGAAYEQEAACWLESRGVRILERNYRCRQGEIDMIGQEQTPDGRYLLFIEVKYRSTRKQGDPAEAVTGRKQNRIRNAACYYLYAHGLGEDTPCRFDVVGILGDEWNWIKNAF